MPKRQVHILITFVFWSKIALFILYFAVESRDAQSDIQICFELTLGDICAECAEGAKGHYIGL